MTMTKLESVLPTHPKIQKFLEARNLDRAMAEEYLRHKDIDKLLASHRLWHTPRIPTFAGAMELYRSRELRTIKSESKRHHSGKYGATVLLYCPQRKVSRGGASIDENEKIARALAFSNAVRQIIF